MAIKMTDTAPVQAPDLMQRMNQMKVGAQRSELTAALMRDLASKGQIRSPVEGVANAGVRFLQGYNTGRIPQQQADYRQAMIDVLNQNGTMSDVDKIGFMDSPKAYMQQQIAYQNASRLQQARMEYEAKKAAAAPRDPKKFYLDDSGNYVPLPGAEEFNRKSDKKADFKSPKLGDFDKMVERTGHAADVEQVAADFKPEYAGWYSRFGFNKLALLAKNNVPIPGMSPEQRQSMLDAAAWWRRLETLHASKRHDLFGSAFTKGEAESWDKMVADPGNAPNFVRNYLGYLVSGPSGARATMRNAKMWLQGSNAPPEMMAEVLGPNYMNEGWMTPEATYSAGTGAQQSVPYQRGQTAPPGALAPQPGEATPSARTDPAAQAPGAAQKKAQFNFYMSRAKQHWKGASPEQRAMIIQKIQQDTGVNVTEGDFQ